MSKRLYSHNKVRYWYSYDVDDICSLFSDTKLHPQTVRKWIKNGLKTIDKGKPALIYGYDLITYLKKNNTKNKCKTEFDQLFCMRCQDARYIFQKKITINQENNSLSVNGLCRVCKTSMHQNYKIADYSQLKKIFSLVDVLQLYDCLDTTDKTHLHAQKETSANESLQMEMAGL